MKFILFILLMSCSQLQLRKKPIVVLISVDGIRNDIFKTNAKIPFLRSFVKEGRSAKVRGIIPTMTYPSHTTLITGKTPQNHGVLNNIVFDPFLKHKNQWYWYAEDIKATTLWKEAKKRGYITGNISWPVSVGANIDYNLPEFWRDETQSDLKIIRQLATKDLLKEVEKHTGPYSVTWTIKEDKKRFKAANYLIENKGVDFLTMYVASYDTVQHKYGPGQKSRETLEKLDVLLSNFYKNLPKNRKIVLAIASDHGFTPVHTEIQLNKYFEDQGYLSKKSWKAYAWNAHGTAAIYVKNEKIRQKIKREFSQNKDKWGIKKILHKKEFLGSFPRASFLLVAKKGFIYQDGRKKIKGQTHYKGSHGYLPSEDSMKTVFLMKGFGIPREKMGEISMTEISSLVKKSL